MTTDHYFPYLDQYLLDFFMTGTFHSYRNEYGIFFVGLF